jgi:hypothetical protein
MTRDEKAGDLGEKREGQPRRVRLPGFVVEGEIGLGDLVGKAATSVGFRPCGGCARRAVALNGWMVFSGRRPAG